MRLIAFTIIIFSGAVAIGLGSLSGSASARGDAFGFGFFLLLVGLVLMCGELYLTRFFQDLMDSITGRPTAQRTSDPAENPPPPP